jgi:hypothetical protein
MTIKNKTKALQLGRTPRAWQLSDTQEQGDKEE